VQGPENALCLDGGRTIMWECIEDGGVPLDRVFAQVGGGALATSLGFACADAGVRPQLHAVQTAGCAPLARAWDRWRGDRSRSWAECMWPWESEPHSSATGILDDETYDWLGIVTSMDASNGSPVVVSEALVAEAHRLVADLTSISADHTGTAALAGVLALRAEIGTDELVMVPVTGVQRGSAGT
jgi:threonine synthase